MPRSVPSAPPPGQKPQLDSSWDGDTVRPGHNPQPADLTIDRDGADERRKEALSARALAPGADRDGYPPALFE